MAIKCRNSSKNMSQFLSRLNLFSLLPDTSETPVPPGGALRVRPREVVGIWSSFHRYLSIVGVGSTAGGALDSGSGVGIAGEGGLSTVSMLMILGLGGALGRSLGS